MEFEVEQIVFPPEQEVVDKDRMYRMIKSLVSSSLGICSCELDKSTNLKNYNLSDSRLNNILENFRVRYNVDIDISEARKWTNLDDIENYLKSINIFL